MTGESLRAAADRVRAIPLEEVLVRSGAERDRADPARWRTAQGPISVRGAKFMNWRRGIGGGGAIDLAMHLRGLNFRSAVAWLAGCAADTAIPVRSVSPTLRKFSPPRADPSRLGEIRRYLVGARGLARSVIDARMAAGDVYADARGNAVFLLRDGTRAPVGAELRGTSFRRWRGMAAGSRKDRGAFAAGPDDAPVAVLCESAIDALSCAMLWPDRRCLSTSGARANAGWLGDLLRRGLQVYCAFDADPTGDALARALIALHPAVVRLRPTRHDWNDVVRAR